MQHDRAGARCLGAEVDLHVGPDLRYGKIVEAAECGAVTRYRDRIEPMLEVGDRVGAVQPREGKAVRAGTADQEVISLTALVGGGLILRRRSLHGSIRKK